MRLFLFLFFCFFPLLVDAGLDEFVIPTQDKKCAIHYLTTRTKYNWTIKVDPSSCQNGWVEGNAEVQLYSPSKELMETLSGFFTQGYWLEETFIPAGRIIERTSPAQHTQSLSFLLGKDEEADITYLGQLRALQQPDRPYSAFTGCPDFRILVVVPDETVFENSAFQDKIAEQGLKYATSYCSELDVLALFGSTSERQPKIIFQMQIDPLSKEKLIIPLSNEFNLSATKPLELRKEDADLLLSVSPLEEDKTLVSYTPSKTALPSKEEGTSPKTQETVLGHLRILSDTSGKPVSGRVVVHINQVLLDGTGVTDLPEEIQLLYAPHLKTGWALIEGVLENKKMRVLNVQFCQQEWCADVS